MTPWDFSVGQACKKWLKQVILDNTRKPPKIKSKGSKLVKELKEVMKEVQLAIRSDSESALEVFISAHYLI